MMHVLVYSRLAPSVFFAYYTCQVVGIKSIYGPVRTPLIHYTTHCFVPGAHLTLPDLSRVELTSILCFKIELA